MDNLNITVTRDSVCMGDDCSAPHSLKFSVPKDSTLEYMFGLLKDKKYLATVKGEAHFWEAKISNELIAQVKGNSRTALIELGVSKETFNYSKDNEVQIHFEYVWKKI